MSDDNFNGVRRLIGTIAHGLEKRGGEGTARVLERLAQQDMDAAQFREPAPRRQPVCGHLAQCIAETMLVDAKLAAALAAVEDRLNWCQSAGYSDALLGEGFLANYGWCEFVGSAGFFPGADFRLGLLLLGPHRHYRDHYHPAPELYWPLTGPSDWKRGAGGFETRAAGETVWHKPFIMHATRTQDMPLLAVWCWTEDTATPVRLAG
ncbi:MAG: dimethylsulfonioproprionate lyase family protein [Hyphomicrobiales bacterium]